MMVNNPRVLFLVPYPLHRAPSQRFRVENLLPLLQEANIYFTIRPFMDEKTWSVLYNGGSGVQKLKGILNGFRNRWLTIRNEAKDFDFVFIHREAAPLGPPIFEWYLKKILRKKIIYDFDDAIWIPNTSAANKMARALKAFWKVGHICKWSYKVSAGNDYLASFVEKNSSALISRIPTVVDTQNRYNKLKQHRDEQVTIGWTGSHSTLKYLEELVPVLSELQKEVNFCLLVIADKEPNIGIKNWRFIPWNPETEIDDLLQIDIGLMPLTADAWSEGKCGFKLIQYLALGIPAVASPVGVNKIIIEEGVNGYLCKENAEWKNNLKLLLTNTQLRQELGNNGRRKIVDNYSITSQKEPFLKLFEEK